MLDDLMQFLVILAVSTVLLVVVGKWIAHFFSSPNHSLIERGTYRLLGVNPEEKMSWKRYGLALLLSNAAMLLLGYILLRVQGWIPGPGVPCCSTGITTPSRFPRGQAGLYTALIV